MTHKNQTMTIEMIPAAQLSYIPEGKRQARKIKELAESIKSRGIIQPLVVTVVDEKGKYQIRRGRRRFEAGKLAGLTEYPCLVTTEDTADAELDIIENTQREPYTATELYAQALSLHPEIKKGASPEMIQAVAGSLGISAVEAQRIINIGRMAKPVTDALAAGEISLGLALLSLHIKEQKMIGAFVKFCKEDHPSLRAGEEFITDAYSGPTNNVSSDCGFDIKDCSKCLKKGGADPALFEDPDPGNKTICWDPDCYAKKTEAAMAAMIAKAKELGLDGVKAAESGYSSWNYTIYGKVKPVDPEKCKACKSVLVGIKDKGLNIVCPDNCANIKGTRGGSDSDRKQKQPFTDKPVLERGKADKIAYLNEKLDMASRKFMIEHFFTGNGNNKKLRPERIPTETKRILFFLGMEHADNPFYSFDMGEGTKKKFYLSFSYDDLAKLPKNIEKCGSHLAANDQSGRGPKDIDEDIELLYGIKGFCSLYYLEILLQLGKTAKAVLESIQPWAPAWAGVKVVKVKAEKPGTPAKTGSGQKKGKK